MLYNVFLRGEGNIGFINIIGWVFMGVSVFNIFTNLVFVLISSISNAGEKGKN